jgi:DNA-binding LacI/PurR family transcriptional regulator
MIAIGALLACNARGIGVPGQMSIVGFDDIPAARFVTPALTTIHQPKQSLGSQAMSILLDRIADRVAQNVVVTPTLVERRSTQPWVNE